MFLVSKLFVLTIIFYSSNAKKLEIKNLQNDPILQIKDNKCKIQIGNIKLVHPIDLSYLEITIRSINKLVMYKLNRELDLFEIIHQKSQKLLNNFRQIKPEQYSRYKRWDSLGTAWKWLAGSPDADDLRIINKTTNDLIDSNNQQFRINEQVNERIRLITETVNKALVNNTITNSILLTEIDMITIIINIDTINSILEDIQDAILRTKSELTSSKILSLREIMSIKDLLVGQGVKISLPDEALQYVTPKIAINNDKILYILQVPKLEVEDSETIMVIPLTNNGTIIYQYPQHLIRSKDKLFITSKHKSFVQKYSDIMEFQDDCIKPLILGTQSKCNVTSKIETSVHYIAEDKILIDNAKGEILSSDCGPNNRTLTGNFLITFWNCTLVFKNKQFQSYEITTETHEIQGALYNLQATRHLVPTINIHQISQQNIQNRKRLQYLHLKQLNHQHMIWTLSGAISFISTAILIAVIYVCARKRNSVVNIKMANQETPTSKITNGQREPSYLQLLKRAGVKRKDEDALSSPPGGVTFPSNTNNC